MMTPSKGDRVIYQQGTDWERTGKVMGSYKEVFGKRQLLDVKWEPNPKFEGTRYEVLAELCSSVT